MFFLCFVCVLFFLNKESNMIDVSLFFLFNLFFFASRLSLFFLSFFCFPIPPFLR
jgi:hypothetical protein